MIRKYLKFLRVIRKYFSEVNSSEWSVSTAKGKAFRMIGKYFKMGDPNAMRPMISIAGKLESLFCIYTT